MAMGGDPRRFPRRQCPERGEAARRARAVSDAAVQRALARAAVLEEQLAAAEEGLETVVGGAALADRLAAVLFALRQLVRGGQPAWLERLRRNVELHAKVPAIVGRIADASAPELRAAQKAGRLGAATGSGAGWRLVLPLDTDAPSFVPSEGRRLALPATCTCGAVVFSCSARAAAFSSWETMSANAEFLEYTAWVGLPAAALVPKREPRYKHPFVRLAERLGTQGVRGVGQPPRGVAAADARC
ncbi:unnamed protein product [Prorocentrum cordatum]|uniref:Uncharacterized protein n=1 Tax=Prorocentrum cordatum TaxID=2364126 RepID=A0ABN9QFQ3_9DINO|nr:unnamed protein product [Polarella glacialis]